MAALCVLCFSSNLAAVALAATLNGKRGKLLAQERVEGKLQITVLLDGEKRARTFLSPPAVIAICE